MIDEPEPRVTWENKRNAPLARPERRFQLGGRTINLMMGDQPLPRPLSLPIKILLFILMSVMVPALAGNHWRPRPVPVCKDLTLLVFRTEVRMRYSAQIGSASSEASVMQARWRLLPCHALPRKLDAGSSREGARAGMGGPDHRPTVRIGNLP